MLVADVTNSSGNSSPSEEEFFEHFDKLYNKPVGMEELEELRTNVYVPILDDAISYDEVNRQIKRLKSNKAGGPDGLPPGLFKMLPVAWILCIATLFNNVFMSAMYPVSWIDAKSFTVFK